MKSGVCARFWAAPLGVLAITGLLAGCSGGGGGTVNPVATPSPSASVVTGVVAQRTLTSTGVSIQVTWQTPSFTPVSNVVEYHVYRTDSVAGVVSKQSTTFTDTGVAPADYTYFVVEPSDSTKLHPIITSGAGPFVRGTPFSYRVTALYVTAETASSATPEYAETEIGQSDAITP